MKDERFIAAFQLFARQEKTNSTWSFFKAGSLQEPTGCLATFGPPCLASLWSLLNPRLSGKRRRRQRANKRRRRVLVYLNIWIEDETLASLRKKAGESGEKSRNLRGEPGIWMGQCEGPRIWR